MIELVHAYTTCRTLLTASDNGESVVNARMLDSKDVYLMYRYRNREALGFPDCQTYWYSLPKHRAQSYMNKAIDFVDRSFRLRKRKIIQNSVPELAITQISADHLCGSVSSVKPMQYEKYGGEALHCLVDQNYSRCRDIRRRGRHDACSPGRKRSDGFELARGASACIAKS